jgi:hypothetical protein
MATTGQNESAWRSHSEKKAIYSRHLYHSRKRVRIMLSFTVPPSGNRTEFVAQCEWSRALKELDLLI